MTWRSVGVAAAVGLILLVLPSSAARSAQRHSRPVAVRVELSSHRVVAGGPLHGSVVLTNSTPHRITVETCADGWLQVALKNRKYSPGFAHLLPACPPTVHLKPGANRFHVTVLTTYGGCLEPGGQSSVSIPACVSGNKLPPLPPGRYVTTVSISGLDHLTRQPRQVRVTLAKRGG